MAHPLMFDPRDPLLLQVREIALDLPGADEKISHGHPAFFTKKVFAYFAGSVKVDGAWSQHEHSLVVLPDEEEARALLEEPRCYRPAYLGPSGWVGVDLDEGTDWLEVAELVESSYRRTARTLDIARLDAR
ncbi:MmcQ/YjbR family DNA-binding protein [Janibacter terrae]|uniref:MmcQ/YjbR family DNA-binding protein n=1 Tax=Janibacter terrae TaxID=103817 RepID=UPI0031F88B8C